MPDLLHVSAGELLAAFRARELSPVEVLAAVEQRADAVEPVVNAFAERLRDSARAAAVEAEARYAGRGGGAPRPLEGVPVVLKEEQPIAGRPSRYGSLLTDDTPATVTHPVAERVFAGGAVVHARTATPEFSCAGFTHSPLWGVTRNPWNLDVTPGGSSGGSGAALAAGEAFLATGSDIAGSIRIPASLSGVVGFKPPYGRVPGLPPFNLDTYCHDGPMARTVADCALLQNVIAGPHPADPVALPAADPIPDGLDARGLRIAYATTVGDYPVEPEVAANTRRFADALRAAGLQVDEIEIPVARETVMTAALTHFGAIFGPSIAEVGLDDLTPYARDFAQLTEATLAKVGFYRGLELEAQVQGVLATIFERYDAVVCPTLGTLGFDADDDYVGRSITVAGVELDHYLAGCLTPLYNIASRHPVLAVPSGRAGNGVPTGVQIAARPYQDAVAFRVGAAAERELRWWTDDEWRPAL